MGIKDEGVIAALSGRKDVVPVYARYGYKNVVWDLIDYAGPIDPNKLNVLNTDSVKIIKATSVQFEELLKYDQIIHPDVERSFFGRNA